ncbi:sugar/nucleoside kinase (ribokinase family) [Devosia sp. UYZn731]|uniref:carbohydrate kinase family protein n=1 Tax=Devosia sp. UYZn731 TaxID=3156345 RepID=UPI00339700C7
MRPLAVVGNVNVDLIMGPTAPWPVPGTEVLVDHDELRVGGSAGNAALALQALGIDFQIAANVGSDAFGKWLAEAFGSRSDKWPVNPTSTTISVGITHPNSERTFFTTRGHLPDFSWADVQAGIHTPSLAGGLLLLCGSFITSRLATDYALLFDWAAANRIDIVLDTGWPVEGWTEQAIALTKAWFARSSHLLVSENEAFALTGTLEIGSALEALEALAPKGATVLIKAGPLGAYARRDGQTLHAPAPKVVVIDTIGAGDVFNASYVSRIARGEDLLTALSAGVAIASTAISSSPRRYASLAIQPGVH